MTSLDTIDTDGVAICRVARPTPETQTRRRRHVKRLKKDKRRSAERTTIRLGVVYT